MTLSMKKEFPNGSWIKITEQNYSTQEFLVTTSWSPFAENMSMENIKSLVETAKKYDEALGVTRSEQLSTFLKLGFVHNG